MTGQQKKDQARLSMASTSIKRKYPPRLSVKGLYG
jgi:hypothetical protein